MDPIAKGGGRFQARRGSGGSAPSSKDARNKVYANAVRLSLGQLKKFRQKTDGKAIFVQMCEVFGENSAEVKEITGIAPSADQTWIIAYGKNKVPCGMIGRSLTLNEGNVEIEDATRSASEYDQMRKEAQEKAVRNITFRIQGLPLDADQKELFDALNLIGFGLDDKDLFKNLRAMYDNYDGHVVRNGIVIFRVP